MKSDATISVSGVKVKTDLQPAEWSAVLNTLPLASRDVYFTPEYHALSKANGEGQPFAGIAFRGSSTLLVTGMRSMVCQTGKSPASLWDMQTPNGYGGPVACGDWDDELSSRAWEEWKGACRDLGMVAAFFRLHPLLHNELLLPADAEVKVDRKTVFVDLSKGIEGPWRAAQGQHRNMVSKGKREGVTIRWNEPSDWSSFQELYDVTMRRMNAPDRLRFSKSYFEMLQLVPGAELAGVRQGTELVSGAIFLFGKLWGHYHLSARSVASANHLTNCILQDAFERAVERGVLGMHLGGGRTSLPDDSLLKFKASTGGSLVDFKTALVIANRQAFDSLCREWRQKTGLRPEWMLGYRQPYPESAQACDRTVLSRRSLDS
jgi:Acetyltransferase (GNAT) domain